MVEKTYHLALYLEPFGAYLMPHIGFKSVPYAKMINLHYLQVLVKNDKKRQTKKLKVKFHSFVHNIFLMFQIQKKIIQGWLQISQQLFCLVKISLTSLYLFCLFSET